MSCMTIPGREREQSLWAEEIQWEKTWQMSPSRVPESFPLLVWLVCRDMWARVKNEATALLVKWWSWPSAGTWWMFLRKTETWWAIHFTKQNQIHSRAFANSHLCTAIRRLNNGNQDILFKKSLSPRFSGNLVPIVLAPVAPKWVLNKRRHDPMSADCQHPNTCS